MKLVSLGMHTPTDSFYSNLPLRSGPIYDVMARPELYHKVPGDWYIIVTDVENSTIAVEQGKQQMIHLAATGSIVACLNIARDAGIDIPFFFGGDGATLLVPDSLRLACLSALQLHQQRCSSSFGFHLRVGARNVGDIRVQTGVLELLKFKRNNLHTMPIVIGDALHIAEKQIKNNDENNLDTAAMNYNLNLEGMECKWDKIRPPKNQNEVLSLIIYATFVSQQFEVYADVLQKIEEIYGDDHKRHPVTPKRLKMVHRINRIKDEVKMKYAKVTGLELSRSWLRSIMGRIYLKSTRKGQDYVRDMIQLTETLLIDGAINTVITGTIKQRESLIAYLDQLESQDQIKYGFYSSKTSVLSCYVTALDDYHIHFLDGEDGGYTQAARVLKKKLR
ncbi:DUF3095 family protein [Nonlabens xiamenensis]|uniref:DUF3095 family protein n=1 Tax=Nonlabens xiamenensis TaxID=2341043 RepID=UPI001F0CA48C|nr:DUF3095 family protein [Nonlabens xiamenensis]